MTTNKSKSLFKDFLDEIVSFIDTESTNKRKYKIDNRYCLEQVCYVLTTGICWKDLICPICHFSSIYKRFRYWVKLNIFEKIWVRLNQLYADKQLESDPYHFKTLFIDSSMIKNHLGVGTTGFNHFDRNRKATKLSVICDENKVPMASAFFKAGVADCKTIECTIKAIKSKLRRNKKYRHILAADKGYIINKKDRKDLYSKYGIQLVTPSRKNQIIKTSEIDKMHLKHRYKIENVFCRLDQFKRIKCREERLLECYAELNYIAMISMTVPFL